MVQMQPNTTMTVNGIHQLISRYLLKYTAFSMVKQLKSLHTFSTANSMYQNKFYCLIRFAATAGKLCSDGSLKFIFNSRVLS